MNGKEVKPKRNESGAALVTTLMITVLLTIACIAILSSAGSNSQNSTDVLSESKAYWAAESGLQSTINVLRHIPSKPNYSQAVDDPDLSTWLTYNCTNNPDSSLSISVGPDPCNLNSGASYRVSVSDPDSTKNGLSFSTVGGYTNANVPTICSADCTDTDKLTLSYTNVTGTAIDFVNPSATNPTLITFDIARTGTGATGEWTRSFSINYTIQVGVRTATRTIRGDIGQTSATSDITITFDSNIYELMGSEMNLCQTSTTNPCSDYSLSFPAPAADGGSVNATIYMTTTPAEPYRLRVLSTGYGPNGAKKQLEGIIQKNFFNGLSGPAAITMQGPGAQLVFDPGNSSVFEINGEDSGGVVIPSVGVVDQDGLDEVNDGIPSNNNNIDPAPEIVTDLPDWMSTPAQLDALVSQLRITAQNSGRYYNNPTSNLNNLGDFATGTGITFCEGDCTAGVDGGGILVVTGQLTNVGGWSFKGLIIITGADGWLRNGGGNGTIFGNVVIAPYTQADVVANPSVFTMPPKYEVTGGGTSDVSYDGIDFDAVFSGTDAISNFMLGIAEK